MGFNVCATSIDNWLDDCTDNRRDPRVAELLKLALSRVLRKELSNQQASRNLNRLARPPPGAPGWLRDAFNAGSPVYEFAPEAELQDQIRHIADWIAASLSNGAAWLQDCDERGRPLKLLKLGSLKQALAEADKAMALAAQSAAALSVTNGHLQTVMEFPDGARIVQLLTPEALDDESRALRHCIGNGGYDEFLEGQQREFFSLRTPSGKAAATMEVDLTTERGTLLQCKGRQNKPPLSKYLCYIQEFLRDNKYALAEYPRMTGLIEQNGLYYDIHRLPDNFHYSGTIDLSGSDIETLPRGMVIDGDLYLEYSKIRELPEDLTVNGSLKLASTKLSRLPDTLKVGSSLSITDTNIAELPKGLHVPFILWADRTPLTKLPEDLRVDGCLTVRGTIIHNVPDGVADVLVSNRQIYQNLLSKLAKCNRTGALNELPSLFDRPGVL